MIALLLSYYLIVFSFQAVIPLNEECGLLEWVQNTHGLRNILTKIYKYVLVLSCFFVSTVFQLSVFVSIPHQGYY